MVTILFQNNLINDYKRNFIKRGRTIGLKNFHYIMFQFFQVINDNPPPSAEKPKSLKEKAISQGLFYHTKTNTKSPNVSAGQSLLRPLGTPSKYSHLNKSPAGNQNQVSPNNSSSNLNGYIPTIVQQQTSIPSTPLNSSQQQSPMRIAHTPKAADVQIVAISPAPGL